MKKGLRGKLTTDSLASFALALAPASLGSIVLRRWDGEEALLARRFQLFFQIAP
jgi:hypothetical protein